MDKDLLLVKVHGPNKDNPTIQQNLADSIKGYKNQNVVAVGDWNSVLYPKLGCCNYKHVNNPKAKETKEKITIELGLTGTWRENNSQCKPYTWRKPTTSN